MHLWKNSSSPSSSKSLPSSPSKQRRVFRDLGHFWSRRNPPPAAAARAQQPRLTRLRKLRGDEDIAGSTSARPSASENSTPLSQSPSPRRERSSSAAAVPVPLPLPDAFLRRVDSGLSSSSSTSNSAHFPLPSPKEVAAPLADGEETDRTAADASSCDPAATRFSWQTFLRSAEHVDMSSGFTLDNGKKVFQDPDTADDLHNNFRLSVPARSAPASGFSSPVLSPRRMSIGDFFPPAYMSSHGQLQFWSDQAFPASDAVFSSYASPEKFVASPECSPLHSPRERTPALRSPSGATTPKHPRASSESSVAWHDNNGVVTVHPLPLPPGATPPQPALVHQPVSIPESSSMMRQWQKGRLIGSGTFGNVYCASNRETGALCAMKEVSVIPDDPKSIECVKSLEQEIKILSQLKHPNIAQYYGSEIVDDRFFIYLEYVHPGSISKYIRDHCGAMTESVVRNFTRHILSGLAYLHSTNTIHRDIKGANLLVDASGVVKLVDFGMAKHLSGRMIALSMKGSPHWMAPEVIQANMMQKDAGHFPAIDIWSLGCTIIEMYTGKPPWSEFTGAAALFKVFKNESPPIPETLSAEGKNFLLRCLQKDPADRPSAVELLEHPFVKCSHHQEINGSIQAISQMKLKDMAYSPKGKMNPTQASLGSQASKGKQVSNGETGKSYPETSECSAASCHSPRSTLDAISSLSPPHNNHSTYNWRSSSSTPNGKHRGPGNCIHNSWK